MGIRPDDDDVLWYLKQKDFPQAAPTGRGPADGAAADSGHGDRPAAAKRSKGRADAPGAKLISTFQERWEAFRAAGPTDGSIVYDVYEVIEEFRRWFYLPDPGVVFVSLGAIAATLLRDSRPVWLQLVGAASSGKTAAVSACAGLPAVYFASTVTESALLSGSPRKERASDATGGLLREIGDQGVIVCKDFGSILSQNRDTRAAVLAGLREVYDGSWSRAVGVDGGKRLTWRGRVCFVGCVTSAIDNHHAVLSALGERFVFYRMTGMEPELQAGRALENTTRAAQRDADLQRAVSGLFRSLEITEPEPLGIEDVTRFSYLATLATAARSPVERDPRTREIELIYENEMPARMGVALATLNEGMKLIGTRPEDRWKLVCKVAFDSMPELRRRALFFALQSEGPRTTVDFALRLGHPTTATRRGLEDLTAHGVLRRMKQGGGPDLWIATERTREQWARAEAVFPEIIVPGEEMSAGSDGDFTEASE